MSININKFLKFDPDKEPTTLWNPCFIMILLLGFATGTANQMVNPLLSKYAVSLGATLQLAGTIVGLQRGSAMFLRPFSGAASDLLNRKYVMLSSIAVTGLAFTGYLLSNSVTMVIICRVLQGVGFAFMSVARTAFASAYMPKDKIGEGVGYTTFGTVLSQAAGPSIGLWISENWGFKYCFIVALCAQIIGFTLLSLIPYKKAETKKDGKPRGKERLKLANLISLPVLPYAILGGIFTMGNILVSSFMPLMGELRGLGNVGIFFTAYSLVAVFMRPFAGKLLDKKGLAAVLIPAYIAGGLSMLCVGYASGLFMIALGGILKACGQGGGQPAIQAAAIKRLGREKAGVASATIQMGQDLLGFIAPTVGGFIVDGFRSTDLNLGYTVLYTLASCLMLCGIAIFLLIRTFEKKAEAKKNTQLSV